MSASLLFFYLGLASSYLVIRPLATLVHESGHLLALRLMGIRGPIHVFLGSLGESKRAWTFQAGRIWWAISPSALFMRGSLTGYAAQASSKQILLIALAGPLSSLLMAATAAALAAASWTSGVLGILCLFASLIAAMDVVLSLMYRYEPILLNNARITANDGQVIGWYLKYGPQTDAYLHARWLFEKDRYSEANAALQALIQAGHTEKLLYEYLMYGQLMVQRPIEAIATYLVLAQFHPLDAYDHCLYALALEHSDQPEIALDVISAAIGKAPGHHEALNHRAFRFMQAGLLDEALEDLNHAIRSNPEFAAAFNNRGALMLSRLELDKAKKDLLQAMKLDHENPYTHRNWAMLMLLEGNHEAARRYMENAKLLGLGAEDVEFVAKS